MSNPYLVSTDWLAERLGDPDLVPVDGSWHLPDAKRNGGAEFLERHIPGAVFFDVDAISDPSSGLPHMLPSPHAFADAVGALGIDEAKTLVIYDSVGLFSAPRVWWSFRAMGALTVYVLETHIHNDADPSVPLVYHDRTWHTLGEHSRVS